jgi:CheY-like chemotaxis protein
MADGAASMILMAEDDEEDRLLAQEALAEVNAVNELRFVVDGEDLMDYLHQRGEHGPGADAPRPAIILLDLNMPRKDGREALAEIKSDPDLRHIPVVVFTTSKDDRDVISTYGLGANSYITKPSRFTTLVEVMRGFSDYWFQVAELPERGLS